MRNVIKYRSYQELVGDSIIFKEISIRITSAKPNNILGTIKIPAVKKLSKIKLGAEKKEYEVSGAIFTKSGKNLAIKARLAGTKDDFHQITIFGDKKYEYLSGEDIEYNNWLDYRKRLRDVRDGFRIGTYTLEQKIRMMVNIIRNFKGKIIVKEQYKLFYEPVGSR